jgi:hypothetical protein
VTKSISDKQLESRPFWFSALNYFLVLVVIAVLLSFISWLITREFDEEISLIVFAIVFLTVLGVGSFIRSKLKRSVQTKILIANNKQNDRIRIRKKEESETKLSVTANSNLVSQIEKKSEAANLLGRIPKVHLEVFECCNEYLEIIDDELKRVGAGSPRLISFLKGRERIKKLHKKHLLQWAETEASELISQSNRLDSLSERIRIGKKTLIVLESALEFYPNEKRLMESREALERFVSSALISESMENAEKCLAAADDVSATKYYYQALEEIERSKAPAYEKEPISAHINQEISRLSKIGK